MLEIIIAVLSGVTSIFTAVLIRTVNRRDRQAEERQRQLIECRTAEMQYTRSIGSLAHYTAKKVKDATAFPIANGDLADAIKYYKQREHDLEDFYQKQTVMNNVKGGG
jgi:hypothetical protein